MRGVRSILCENQSIHRKQTSMSDTRRGLPLSSSRIEQIFPKLTPDQIRRVAAQGHIRAIQPGEVLIEQGDSTVPFFVVITGEIEIVRPFGRLRDTCHRSWFWSVHRRSQHALWPPVFRSCACH